MSVRFDILLKQWELTTKPMIQITQLQNTYSMDKTSVTEATLDNFYNNFNEGYSATTMIFNTETKLNNLIEESTKKIEKIANNSLHYHLTSGLKFYDNITIGNKTYNNYLHFLINISNIQLILSFIIFIILVTVFNLTVLALIKKFIDCCKRVNKKNCCKKMSCWVIKK